MRVIERLFLEAIRYNVWVRDDEYEKYLSRMDGLWEEVLQKKATAARHVLSDFVLRRFENRWL